MYAAAALARWHHRVLRRHCPTSNNRVGSRHFAGRRRLPVAAFIDLDTVGPTTHRPSDAERFVGPLIELERRLNGVSDDDAASKVKLEAFCNPRAQRLRGENEKEKRSLPTEQADTIPWPRLDAQKGISGLDSNATLRCGICEYKIELTEAEQNDPTFTLFDKLKSHITREHKKEQRGRRLKMHATRRKNKKKSASSRKATLSEKERELYRRYDAAVAGLKELKQQVGGPKRQKKSRISSQAVNDPFHALRQMSVRVKMDDYHREALTRAADRWMDEVAARDGGHGMTSKKRGVLLVYSKHLDFVHLLSRARGRRFIAVSATDEIEQTKDIQQCSDVVFGPFGEWTQAPGRASYNTTHVTHQSKEAVVEEGGFVIEKVSHGPLSLLMAPSFGDAAMCAIATSDDGEEFMGERRREASNCANETQYGLLWHLEDNLAARKSRR